MPSLEKKVFSLDKEPKSLEVFGNIIAVNFGTEVLFINNYGWLIKNIPLLKKYNLLLFLII